MDQHALLEIVKNALGEELLREKGEVLYNSIDTLAPNDLYVAGHNPGGRGHRTISEDIMQEEYRTPYRSKYDQPWANKPYGRKTKELLKHMGYDYHTVFITNTFFSASPTEILLPKMSEDTILRYMRLHLKLLSIVRPKYILCLGQSAFRHFRGWATEKSPIIDEDLDSGRFYKATFPDILPALLIGVRHPSRGSAPTEEFYNRFFKLSRLFTDLG